MQLDQEAREGMEKYMKLIQEPADVVELLHDVMIWLPSL